MSGNKPEKTLVDQEQRQAIRSSFDETLVVEAAAGTGKTTETIARIVALLCAGRAHLSRIACVTFTEKAAGEMKLRLRTELDRRKQREQDPVVSARLAQALRELEEARIGTIHGFCADILRERPVEARVDPLFEVASDDEARALYGECFDLWFQESLEAPGEGLRRALRRRTRERGADGPRGMLESAGFRLTDARDFPAPWKRAPIDKKAEIDAMLARLQKLGEYGVGLPKTDPPNFLVVNLHEVGNAVSEILRREDVQKTRDYDGLEAELRTISRLKSWGWKGSGKFLREGVLRQDVANERDALKIALDALVVRLDADLAACLFAELSVVTAAYERRKARAGRLDFRDLLVKTRDLVRDDLVVREELMSRFSHLLVDEFQDTDPLQAEILLLLSGQKAVGTDAFAVEPLPGKLFVVGDPKQSIYRFRRADVALYERVKKHLVARGARVLNLTTSFRSAPSIQRAVNTAFADRMLGQPGQATYVPLSPFKNEPPDHPTLVALPVPRPYSDWGKVVSWKIEESLPDAVGAYIDWLVRKSGYTVEESGGTRVPLAARHICILFKRLQSMDGDRTRPYVRALETRRIAHALVGGRSFFLREEVSAMVAALTAMEWPDDELSVYATLRGPFVALTDAEILAYKDKYGLHPFKQPKDEELTPFTRPVAQAMDLLRKLHRARNLRPFAETIRKFLSETRAHAALAFWPAGEQALANTLRMMDIARRFERQRPRSFRAFVLYLGEQLHSGSVEDAPVVEETSDGVRMMTVHRSKGLEFPVVILADPAAPATQREPSRYVDAERGLFATQLAGCVPLELSENKARILEEDAFESDRLLYVAATRAKEMLIVPVVGDERVEGWLSPMHPVIYPKRGRERAATALPGGPEFGGDSVLERPAKARAHESMSVRPGVHEPEAGDSKVVFWDPHALELDREDEVGMRQQKILAADKEGVIATSSMDQHAAWAQALGDAISRASKPALVTTTVTKRRKGELPKEIPAVEITVVSARDDRGTDRPRGARFGTLVHEILATLPIDASKDDVEATADLCGRMAAATPAEISAAGTAVRAALAHPLFLRARNAAMVFREAPIGLALEDGSLVEGACDLAFVDGEELVVVDYKTDADIAPHRQDYERQLRLYAAALARETGKTATGVLLLV
jgi:ATP-dependent exoDNAse (exonuclease V) beta subunit